jgi:hypothetical protein
MIDATIYTDRTAASPDPVAPPKSTRPHESGPTLVIDWTPTKTGADEAVHSGSTGGSDDA